VDNSALNMIVTILSIASYLVTFLLGYGIRSYLDSRQRRYD
jgi:hypothetical protein